MTASVLGGPPAATTKRTTQRRGIDLRTSLAALAAFALLRLASAGVMTWAAVHPVLLSHAKHGHHAPAAPMNEHGLMASYWRFAASWDGFWFRRIAYHGYPQTLPIQHGHVARNAWAFLPMYPMAVRTVMHLSGSSFPVVGGLLSLAAAAVAVVLMVALLEPRLGRFGAFAVAVLVAAFPASPVLQMTYSDAFGLLVLVAVLLALDRQAWLSAAALMLVAGLTRPLTGPLLVVVLVVVAVRWWHRRTRAITRGEWARIATLLVGSVLGVGLWPLIAWWRTGVRDAYSSSELAWHQGHGLQPFGSWLHALTHIAAAPWDLVPLVALALGYVGIVLSPLAARLGPALRAWCVVYAAYIGFAGGYVTSHIRFALLLFPLGAIVTGTAARRQPARWLQISAFTLCLLTFVGLQAWWILSLLRPVTIEHPI